MKKASILTEDLEHCFLCGRPCNALHHVLHGARRTIADKLHLVIPLCNDCHTMGAEAVHRNTKLDEKLKAWAQEVYEKSHSHEEWMEKVGKNYR